METSNVTYLGDLRTEAVHIKSGKKIITDAPPDNQGRGEFFSPTDLMATSLASCMITIIGIATRTHGFDINGAVAKVTKVMINDPRRVGEIIIDLQFPHNNYSEKERKIIEHAVANCPVAKSLHPDLKQTVTISYKQ
ncbi:MAG: OsmC family protein [Bacteroidales bacterium]|nr:OsmC family protein [Bacteroidales bacterium]